MSTVQEQVTVPTFQNYPSPSYMFNSPKTLFSECANDPMSMMVRGGNALNQFIPAVRKNTWNENVSHMSYALPTGYDGSQSYTDFNNAKATVEACDFASAGMKIDICEYDVPYSRFTFSSKDDPLMPGGMGGISFCEKFERFPIRGTEFLGLRFNTDEEWVMSGVAAYAENHMNWNVLHGSFALHNVGNGQSDGLMEILTPGYVAARKIGLGNCVGEDPLILNAASKTTANDILLLLYDATRKIIKRHMNAGQTPGPGDIGIVMHPEMWTFLAENLATGEFFTRVTGNNQITFNTSDDAWYRKFLEYTTGGFGVGSFPVGSYRIPIIPEDRLGVQATVLDEDDNEIAAVTGNILILSRRFGSMNILENQYVDWRQVPQPTFLDYDVLMDGLFLQTYETVNSCWHMNMEAKQRLVSKMQRLQGRINNVTVPIRGDVTYESGSMLSKEFWAYDGAVAHAGVAILNPVLP